MGRARGTVSLASQTAPGAGLRSAPPRAWSDERIWQELNVFLDGRTSWPTAVEFSQAGQRNLFNAIKRNGGVAPWAQRAGLPLRARQDRGAYPVEEAVRLARELAAEYGRLPGAVRIAKLGHPRLAWLVEQAGGAAAFSAHHDLTA